ncbi:uncharacterized protein LOC129584646 [Paramacrobiotus metropolitanus]|uniref:uncharacterized protein LOC129584646 n=1 Tax=Paramacrobiotus metropolitanus TaxID=2943436 RepID=UPI002446036D|nr:uncharacterized protein LOC129584646 [Paramacrobiotus metropolitanus]
MLNLYHLNAYLFRSVLFIWISLIVTPVFGTNRYYGTYLSYGSGDTIIQTFHAHSGKEAPDRKWHVECLDGEAIVGIQDWVNDFQKIEAVWCKFMFPYKPPTNGMYPYYPICFLRNYTSQFFCFNPQHIQLSVNSFITGFWDNELQFLVFRKGLDDSQLYKCCRVPPGYYIDYTSCYYMPTHDQYWEYYDSLQHIIVYCASGYVMTGLSKKINPYDAEWHIEWIQCCRIGFGGAGRIPPPTRIQRSVDAEDEDIDLYQDALASLQIPKNYSAFFRQPTSKLLTESNRFDGFSTSAPVIL